MKLKKIEENTLISRNYQTLLYQTLTYHKKNSMTCYTVSIAFIETIYCKTIKASTTNMYNVINMNTKDGNLCQTGETLLHSYTMVEISMLTLKYKRILSHQGLVILWMQHLLIGSFLECRLGWENQNGVKICVFSIKLAKLFPTEIIPALHSNLKILHLKELMESPVTILDNIL